MRRCVEFPFKRTHKWIVNRGQLGREFACGVASVTIPATCIKVSGDLFWGVALRLPSATIVLSRPGQVKYVLRPSLLSLSLTAFYFFSQHSSTVSSTSVYKIWKFLLCINRICVKTFQCSITFYVSSHILIGLLFLKTFSVS